ncbi:ribose-phosphate pyrophosphokinase [Clostridium acetireducens DSM 10703]|jgi:competence protein ComFC|uniref:Ribose-phosphate pyrophosphokinase n=1 Tax=Clostridium acetireducens DSM 10703 TaxID=1121290 RepID=A0A1E8EWM0_9CLOT|nr:ComF family protein [Clostridium acetireducens]OFI05031.1 ribose-phosphate pyrophosphokinase [Clostridium acetireducens DSM 10703]
MGNRFIKNIKYVIDCILSVIYSDEGNCVICNKILYDGRFICDNCTRDIKLCKHKTNIKKQEFSFSVYSSAYYSGVMKELILNLKYHRDFKSGEIISEYMFKNLLENNMEFDAITYVPVSRKKLKKRGYNQSKYLAKNLSEKTEKSLINSLNKIKDNKDQIGLNKEERWKNNKDCFCVKNKNKIVNKKILLVDDVITTGSTAFFCSKELIKNGAKEVIVLTAAKSSI